MLYYDYFILSSVCILPLVCILAPVCSLQSAFCTEWKFTEKELKVQATKEQVIIEGIKPSNTRPVCKCIYWRENQNKIAVQLSSTVHVVARLSTEMHIKQKARATIVSYPQYRIRRDREPSRISYKWVPASLW